jgi:phenylacetate-coenzyme A ligase PaaK-like adenylate-forming protein
MTECPLHAPLRHGSFLHAARVLAGLLTAIRKAREVRRASRLPRVEFERLKLDKFRRLARHAYERSPYYRRITAERVIDVATCEPHEFPVLTKSLLMSHFDEIVTAPGITKETIARFLTRSKDPAYGRAGLTGRPTRRRGTRAVRESAAVVP